MRESKPFIDTNVIVYAFEEGARKQEAALNLLVAGGVTSVQVLNEFASVARRKLGFGWTEIEEAVAGICVLLPNPAPLRLQTHARAVQMAERFDFSIYDGLIVAAALEAGCSVLYTEDMQHGQKIGELVINNPFR